MIEIIIMITSIYIAISILVAVILEITEPLVESYVAWTRIYYRVCRYIKLPFVLTLNLFITIIRRLTK